MDLMAAITGIPGIGPALPYIAAAVALAAALAPFLRAPKQPSGAYAAFYALVNFVALNVYHAKNAGAPTGTPSTPAVVALLVAGLSLTACANDGSLTPQAQRVVGAVCVADALAQPVAVAVAPSLAPTLAPAAGVDAALVHPAVVAACAAVGGHPVGVRVAPAG